MAPERLQERPAGVGVSEAIFHRRLFRNFYRNYSKRALDFSLVTLSLLWALPLMVMIAALVSVNGGQPFFGHERIGLRGRNFKCWKFRTMHPNSEEILNDYLLRTPEAAAEWLRDHKLVNDPRITLVGKFLRRTSLDELPQLLNVFFGDMSLVGPRPVTAEELEKYHSHLPKYLALRPGLTGIWQVHGRGRVSYHERVEMDVRYYQRVSFLGDLWLMLQTTLVFVRWRGR